MELFFHFLKKNMYESLKTFSFVGCERSKACEPKLSYGSHLQNSSTKLKGEKKKWKYLLIREEYKSYYSLKKKEK